MKNWFKIFILFFMFGLLVYFDSLNNKFLLDDHVFLDNPVLSNIKYVPSQWNPYRDQALGVVSGHKISGYYRPTAHIIYDFCYTLFKNNYWQYHLLNLLLFVFASSLIYVLMERITQNDALALLTGILYLVHPINGVIVNYISANVFALQVIFMLGTILLLLVSLERNNDRACYVLSLCCCFLSLFWHESGIMIPFYVSAIILLFRKDPYKAKIFYLLPYFIIVLSYIIFRSYFIDGSVLKLTLPFHATGWEYLANIFRVFGWYVSKLFYPKGIVLQWVMPISHTHTLWINVVGLSLLVSFFLVCFRFAKKIGQLAIIWLLIGFVPACLATFRSLNAAVYIEPHWFVFSSIGFFILAAYFFLFILNHTRIGGLFLLFMVFLSYGIACHAYNRVWADQKTYALYWSQQAPGLDSVYIYLGDAYRDEGDFKGARKYYKEALTRYPSDYDIYNNLGYLDTKDADWKGAELNFRKALRINSFAAAPYNALGFVYLNQGQSQKAQKYFLQALAYNPLLIEARLNLAMTYFKNSEDQKAIDLCLRNIDMVKDDPPTLLLLVDIYIQENDLVNAKKYAYRIINFVADPQILTKLGVVMAQHNNPIMAIDCFQQAIHIAPGYKDAYLAGGTLLANLGKYNEAINIWRMGAALDTSDQRFRIDIANAMALRLK